MMGFVVDEDDSQREGSKAVGSLGKLSDDLFDAKPEAETKV